MKDGVLSAIIVLIEDTTLPVAASNYMDSQRMVKYSRNQADKRQVDTTLKFRIVDGNRTIGLIVGVDDKMRYLRCGEVLLPGLKTLVLNLCSGRTVDIPRNEWDHN
jgi:hypothetical protein